MKFTVHELQIILGSLKVHQQKFLKVRRLSEENVDYLHKVESAIRKVEELIFTRQYIP